MCASTLWPFSSSTRNMALGNGSTTVPSTRIVSSLGLARTLHLLHAGRAEMRAKTFWGRPTMLYEAGPFRQSDISPGPGEAKSRGLERHRARTRGFGRAFWPVLPRERQDFGAVVGHGGG